MFTNITTERSFRVCSVHCLIVKNLQQQKHLENWFTEQAKKCSEESAWMENEFNLLLFHQELDQAISMKYTGYD